VVEVLLPHYMEERDRNVGLNKKSLVVEVVMVAVVLEEVDKVVKI